MLKPEPPPTKNLPDLEGSVLLRLGVVGEGMEEALVIEALVVGTVGVNRVVATTPAAAAKLSL